MPGNQENMNNEQKNVVDVYNKIAREFSNTRSSVKWQWITDFIESLPKKSSILDVGCGNGRNMKYNDYHFYGIDNSKIFIEICNEQDLNIVKGNMIMIPFSNESFDHIINIAAFHHLSTQIRRQRAVEEMLRVLKPNGKILISVWSINQPKKTKRIFSSYGHTMVPWKSKEETYERYYYIFKIDELKQLFEKAGLIFLSHKWDYGNEIFVFQKK